MPKKGTMKIEEPQEDLASLSEKLGARHEAPGPFVDGLNRLASNKWSWVALVTFFVVVVGLNLYLYNYNKNTRAQLHQRMP